MDEVAEGSVAASWPDSGKLQWNQTQEAASSSAMNMISSSGFFEHQSLLSMSSMPYLSGFGVEKQGLTSEDFASSSLLGTTFNTLYHHQSEDTLQPAHMKQDLRTDNAGSCLRQVQSNGLIQPLHQDFLDVPHDLLQKLLRGSLKLPKLERSPSIGSSGDYPSCQDISRAYQSVLPLPNRGALLSSSLSSGAVNTNSSLISDASPYFAKGPWIDEARNGPSERRFHLPERAHGQQMRSTAQQSPSQSHGATTSASGPTRPRTRARRGQATDPHSIAERKRREKISNATKQLQELVPTLNKADKMAFVEDVIEYVRFLQVQTKVFIMSRLGSTGASLVAETAGQVQEGLEAVRHDLQDYNMATVEEEIARLLEEDICEALRTLQSKGLCMMPISLASVMPIHDTKQPTGLGNATT